MQTFRLLERLAQDGPIHVMQHGGFQAIPRRLTNSYCFDLLRQPQAQNVGKTGVDRSNLGCRQTNRWACLVQAFCRANGCNT